MLIVPGDFNLLLTTYSRCLSSIHPPFCCFFVQLIMLRHIHVLAALNFQSQSFQSNVRRRWVVSSHTPTPIQVRVRWHVPNVILAEFRRMQMMRKMQHTHQINPQIDDDGESEMVCHLEFNKYADMSTSKTDIMMIRMNVSWPKEISNWILQAFSIYFGALNKQIRRYLPILHTIITKLSTYVL